MSYIPRPPARPVLAEANQASACVCCPPPPPRGHPTRSRPAQDVFLTPVPAGKQLLSSKRSPPEAAEAEGPPPPTPASLLRSAFAARSSASEAALLRRASALLRAHCDSVGRAARLCVALGSFERAGTPPP